MRWPIFTSTRFGPSLGLSLIVGSSVLLSFFANFANWVKSELPSYIKHDHIYLDQRWVNFANDLLAAATAILQMKMKVKVKGSNFANDLGSWFLSATFSVILQLCQNFFELFVQ